MGPEIAIQLGKHSQYFEPFCGSMAVLFAKKPSSQETVNDLHGDVTNLAWVLQDQRAAADLYDRAVRTLFAEELIRSYWKDIANSPAPEKPDAERAYKFFVFSWAMRNGVAGTSRVRGNGFQIATRFTAGGGSPTIRFKSAVESIPEWHDRLRNVVVLRRDGLALLDRFEDTDKLAIYADPPYFSGSRSGYNASGATSRYEHEFEHDNPMFGDDHTRLRDHLERFKSARVVVSYYDCLRIRGLYEGWTIVERSRQKNLHVQNKRGSQKQKAPEILIMNGPELAHAG